MMLDTNAFQSKPTSLEEGPMTSQPDVENGNLIRVERSTNYQRCMGFIKLILYLELIVFVGWIGCIFISNYYLYRPYIDDSTPHDQPDWKDDFYRGDSQKNGKPISTDDVVTRQYRNDESTPRNWINGEDDSSVTTPPMHTDDMETRFAEQHPTTANTERDRTTTTPVMPHTKDAVETEAPTSTSEKTTEASVEIPSSGWSGILNIPAFEDDITEDNVEENNNSDKSDSNTSDDRIIFPDDAEYSAAKVPKSGLIHVIDYHFSDLNAAPRPNVSRPFPLLPSMESDTTASTVIPEVEDDRSTDNWFTTKLSELADTPNDELVSPVDENADYADSHMKEILFPVDNWNDYSEQSDAEGDVVDSSTESSPTDDEPQMTSAEILEDIFRIFDPPLRRM